MPKGDLTSFSAKKPTQFEPTPSDHAVSTIDWIARLASDTANRVFSITTTIARAACAIYGPLHDNEMPGLTVHAAGRQPSGLDDLADDVSRHSLVLVSAHSQHRAHGLEDL